MESWTPDAAPDYAAHPFTEVERLHERACGTIAHARESLELLAKVAARELHCRQLIQQGRATVAALQAQAQIVPARRLHNALDESAPLIDRLPAQLDSTGAWQSWQAQLEAATESLENLCQTAQHTIPYLDQLKLLGEADPDKGIVRQAFIEKVHHKIRRCRAILDKEQSAIADFLKPAATDSWKQRVAACFDEQKRLLNDLMEGLQVEEPGWFFNRTKILPLDTLDDAQLESYQQAVDAHLRTIGQALEKETAYSQTLNAYEAYQQCANKWRQQCQRLEQEGRFAECQPMEKTLHTQQARIDSAIKSLSSRAAMRHFVDTAQACRAVLEEAVTPF